VNTATSEIYKPVELLLIDDSAADVRLTQQAFADANACVRVHVATDGLDAMAFLNREGIHVDAPRPDFILLDLNVPKINGRDVLARIKTADALKTIPVVVLTTSAADLDINTSYRFHANCYLTKPVRLDDFENLVRCINSFWIERVKLPSLVVQNGSMRRQ
jgi:two-component system, chemotaxis family, response regulator Rcp1